MKLMLTKMIFSFTYILFRFPKYYSEKHAKGKKTRKRKVDTNVRVVRRIFWPKNLQITDQYILVFFQGICDLQIVDWGSGRRLLTAWGNQTSHGHLEGTHMCTPVGHSGHKSIQGSASSSSHQPFSDFCSLNWILHPLPLQYKSDKLAITCRRSAEPSRLRGISALSRCGCMAWRGSGGGCAVQKMMGKETDLSPT